MRVAHIQYDDVANPWVGGGGAVRAHEIYRRLAGDVEVTAWTGNYPGARDLEREGVRYRRLGAARPYPVSRWSFAHAATALLARGDYDAAVVDHSLYTPLRLPRSDRVALNFGQLVGPTARTRWGRSTGALLERLERRRILQAVTVSVVSRFLLEQVRPLARADARFFVVSAGVDDELFAVERAEADYLLYYGRFDVFQKGIDRVIEAASVLLRARPDLRLILAGRGRDADRIRRMAAASPAAGRISIEEDVGPARRAELFAGALLLLMPSRFEGFGMVAAEAMAAAVPLVASRRDSLPEVIGDAGVLVDPESVTEIGEAARAVLDDSVLRATLSAKARERARQYRWDVVARDHRAMLDHLAAPRTGAAAAS